MKEKKLGINVVVEPGKELVILVDELKEFLKNNNRLDANEVRIQISDNDNKEYIVNLPLATVRKAIKLSDIVKESIVPKNLRKYLVDLTEIYAKKNTFQMVGRDEEIEKIWFFISQKKKNNVFVIGEADVGKTSIVKEIARQIATNECPKEFYEHRVLLLKPEAIIGIDNSRKYSLIISKIAKLIEKNRNKLVIYIDNPLYMKYDEELLILLYSLIIKFKVPTIMTLRTSKYLEYFMEDSFLEKYDNVVEVSEPEYDEIYPMIKGKVRKIQAKYKIKVSEEMAKFAIFTSSLTDSAESNIGKSIDTIEKPCMEAKISGKNAIDKKCILKCYDSYKKMYKNMDKEEIRRIAYHETGHFLTLMKSQNIHGIKTLCVSILPMMDFLGVNTSCSLIGKDLNVTKEYMVDYIAMLLAGRIAESKLTQCYSAGASSDLEAANQKAEEVVMKYAFGDKQRTYYLGESYVKTYLLTDKERETINSQISSILEKAYKRAENIIDENMNLLKFIVEKLIEEEVITGEELEKIISNFESQNN